MPSSPDPDKPHARATLEIVGAPGTFISVFTEAAWDAASVPIYEGPIAADGMLRLRVLRTPLRVVASGWGVASVRFKDQQTRAQVNLFCRSGEVTRP